MTDLFANTSLVQKIAAFFNLQMTHFFEQPLVFTKNHLRFT